MDTWCIQCLYVACLASLARAMAPMPVRALRRCASTMPPGAAALRLYDASPGAAALRPYDATGRCGAAPLRCHRALRRCAPAYLREPMLFRVVRIEPHCIEALPEFVGDGDTRQFQGSCNALRLADPHNG